MTTAIITRVENGYIAEFEDSVYVHVDEARGRIPAALHNEMLRELHRAIDDGHATKFSVTINVEPLNDTTIQTAP